LAFYGREAAHAALAGRRLRHRRVLVRVINGYSDSHQNHGNAQRFVAKPGEISEKKRVSHHESSFSARTEPSRQSQLQTAPCFPTDPCPNAQTQNSKILEPGAVLRLQVRIHGAEQRTASMRHPIVQAGRVVSGDL
jgi:hypothetical protein